MKTLLAFCLLTSIASADLIDLSGADTETYSVSEFVIDDAGQIQRGWVHVNDPAGYGIVSQDISGTFASGRLAASGMGCRHNWCLSDENDSWPVLYTATPESLTVSLDTLGAHPQLNASWTLPIRSLQRYAPGDANTDGAFNSADFVEVFEAGRYERTAGWSQGDWNGDRMFDSGDLLAAFQRGGYEQPTAAVAVPEPGSLMALVVGLLLFKKLRRIEP